MGEIQVLTGFQKKVLSLVTKTPKIRDAFYFTGGTALSAYYLHHRYSDDMDLFSEDPITPDTLFPIVTDWARLLHATVQTQFIDERMYICTFAFPGSVTLKVDFCYYPYARINKGLVKDGIIIDSLFDIGINKLISVVNRATAKDFVDLYYLLPKFGYWDLAAGAQKKFRVKVDPVLFGTDLMAVENISDLPRMIKPLTLEKLISYFRDFSVKLAKTSVID